MILGLLVAVLVLLSWLTLMFMWWQKEQKSKEALASEVALTYFEKLARLARRGWYVAGMYLDLARLWGNKQMRALFLRLFPSAAPAFAKHDEFAGPSSHFLSTISEQSKDTKKKIA